MNMAIIIIIDIHIIDIHMNVFLVVSLFGLHTKKYIF